MEYKSKKLSLLFADDHPQFLQGIIPHVKNLKGAEIIGQAANGIEALHLIRLHQPDIAVLDIQMPILDGFKVAQIIIAEQLKTKIVFLTLYDDESFIKKGFGMGIKGYVLKESALSDIINCLESVSHGGVFASPQVAGILGEMQ